MLTILIVIIGLGFPFLILFLVIRNTIKIEREKAEKEWYEKQQIAKDERYREWYQQLCSCYITILDNIYRDDYDVIYKNEYEPIWKLEKVQHEPRYKKTFDNRLKEHIELLKNLIDTFLPGSGYFSVCLCLNAMKSLKGAYHNNTNFDSAIKILTRLYEKSQENTIYINCVQYGEWELTLINPACMIDLEARIYELVNKLEVIDKNLSSLLGVYYENLDPSIPNVIDYAAELLWCVALRKPFNRAQFDEAEQQLMRYTAKYIVDNQYYTKSEYLEYLKNKQGKKFSQVKHIEQLLALIYAKNLIGGQSTVNQEKVRIINWVNDTSNYNFVEQCYLLPSALAWMGLYDLEREVLRQLVEQKVTLPADLEERLGFLESGGNPNIKIYDVDTLNDFLYDSSSIGWNLDSFAFFFRKLDVMHKSLQYSLAISKWTKTLPLLSKQKITQDQIEKVFSQLVKDFEGEVIFRKGKAKALDLTNIEYENSFIFKFTTERNRCVSILFSSEKYGRNLNITIITLFTPEEGLNNEELRKYALSIKENIYVDSFRESILQAIDEVIEEDKIIYDDEIIYKNIID